MNTNDQWFEPGDKVMRVSYPEDIGLVATGYRPIETHFGKVLCVDDCWTGNGFSAVSFVGVPDPWDRGFYACCFRKVEEIKLCVRAAEKFSQPQTEDQPA
jgi:hypothetical protein